jgi:hypothetical protein
VAETSSRNEVVDSVGFVLKLISHVRDCRGAPALPVVLPSSETRARLGDSALWHQLALLNRSAHKPRLRGKDRLLWVVLKGWWPNWRSALILFQPETVIAWQRAEFKWFWRWKSRPRGGRPRKHAALVELFRRMWEVNPIVSENSCIPIRTRVSLCNKASSTKSGRSTSPAVHFTVIPPFLGPKAPAGTIQHLGSQSGLGQTGTACREGSG